MAQVPAVYTAYIGCQYSGAAIPVYACVETFKVRANGQTQIYSQAEFERSPRRMSREGTLIVPLPEHFELSAMNSDGDGNLVLEVVIRDANGRQLFQDQAEPYDGVFVRN